MPRYKLLILTFIAEGVALATAIILARFLGIKLFPLSKNIFRDIFIGTIAVIIPFAFFLLLLSEKFRNIYFVNSLKKTVLNDIKPLFYRLTLLDICIISLLAGISEELLFRGVLQTKFGIFAASIIFGLFHLITPLYFVIAVIMGVYLGIFF